MRRWFALSAIGRDRPGIVADLAELIYECDCNLEDSSMTILGTEFAVLLLLSRRGRRRRAAPRRGLQAPRVGEAAHGLLPAARGRATAAERAPRQTVPMECSVTGVDKAGIVARVARTLAEHGVNITALHTQSRPEPETGTPIFTMRIRMAVPAALDRRALRERLEQVAAELRVDLTLGDVAAET